jgi:hypothetical protein
VGQPDRQQAAAAELLTPAAMNVCFVTSSKGPIPPCEAMTEMARFAAAVASR